MSAFSAWFVVALGMLWGGTLGNFYDRYFIGGVRDFIKWFVVVDGKERVWPNFNIADSGICVGVGIIVVMEIARSLRGKTAGDPEDDEDTPAERESDGSAVSASTPRSGAS